MFNTWKIQMFDKYLLNEQAISRSDAESGVSHIASVIIEHLLKVLIFGPKCSAYNHWIKELDGWFKRIAEIKLKPKSYHPSLKDIRKWAREEPLEDLRSYLNDIRAVIFEEKDFLPVAQELLENNFDAFCVLYDTILSTCCNKPTYEIKKLYATLKSWFDKYSYVY